MVIIMPYSMITSSNITILSVCLIFLVYSYKICLHALNFQKITTLIGPHPVQTHALYHPQLTLENGVEFFPISLKSLFRTNDKFPRGI